MTNSCGDRSRSVTYPTDARLDRQRATRRQDLPKIYRLNGAISLYRTEAILAGEAESGEPIAFVMDSASSIDLDTPEDWRHAEERLSSRAKQQKPER